VVKPLPCTTLDSQALRARTSLRGLSVGSLIGDEVTVSVDLEVVQC
jgi:hypothetical protein